MANQIALTQDELDKVLSKMTIADNSEKEKIQEEVRQKISNVISQVKADNTQSQKSTDVKISQEELDKLFQK